MKTESKILTAFLLNLAFSVFEFVGGLWIGSVAILSDALHDLGDAMGIGLSFYLERKSKRPPDENHTYGYARYSVMGSLLMTAILLAGSALVIYNAVKRILTPVEIHYNGMILFAIIGIMVNLIAAYATAQGESLNQKAVNLHMLEDVLGWAVVLVGAVVMRFTDFVLIDPLMSIGVAVIIAFHALKNMKSSIAILLETKPEEIDTTHLTQSLCQVSGVKDVHHVHIWSIDEATTCATMHVVVQSDIPGIKTALREALEHHGIHHVTLELETEDEHCGLRTCSAGNHSDSRHHHHHHHH